MTDDVTRAGDWLRSKRAALGASTTLVARMATLIANRQGDPVRIHQQQISDIENAAPGRGPRSLRPWFRHARAAFDSGLIADALGRSETRSEPAAAGGEDRDYFVHDETGALVGRLTLFAQGSGR